VDGAMWMAGQCPAFLEFQQFLRRAFAINGHLHDGGITPIS
jgi:hypothetical protein